MPVRGADAVEKAVRGMLEAGDLRLPKPRGGSTGRRWAALADWGRVDLAVARLAEGHADAVAILAEAGLAAHAGALYGVWAARPDGVGAWLDRDRDGRAMAYGSVRFCSGARMLDRALVVAEPGPDGSAPVLVEIVLDQDRVVVDPDSWQADGMAASDTLEVSLHGARVDRIVGGPGWYTGRRGFAAGGGGVAAVWWGGAVGLLEGALVHARQAGADQHGLAHLGELHALLASAHALLRATADELDALPESDHGVALATVRGAVEHACREVVDRIPRVLGPASWSGDGRLAGQLADLQMYLRQHHGERDYAELGRALLTERDW